MLFLEPFQHSNIQYSLIPPLGSALDWHHWHRYPATASRFKIFMLHSTIPMDEQEQARAFRKMMCCVFFCFWHLKFVLYGMFLVFLCLGWTKELCMRWIDFSHSNMRSSKCNQDCTNQISSVLRLVGTFLLRVKNFWDCLNANLSGCPRHFKLQQRTPPGSRLARTLEEDLALTCSQCNLTYKE